MAEVRRSSSRRAPRAARRSAPPRGWRRAAGWYVAADRDRRHHGLPVRLDAADVAQGPARPDLLGAAAVPPERPDARQLRSGCSTALPIPTFFLNSVIVVGGGRAAERAGRRAGRLSAGEDAVPRPRARSSTLLLATLIVPAQLTYIPSFVLAVNVFHYYDTLPALIFPNLVSAFNIFLLRQAFRGVPNDLHRCRAGRRRRGVADLVADPAADRPAVAGGRRDLHVRHVVERLPVAVADAPHAGRA